MLDRAYEIGRNRAYVDAGIEKVALSNAGWRALIGAAIGAPIGQTIGGEVFYWSAPEGSYRAHLLERYTGEGVGLAGGALAGAGLGAAAPAILRAARNIGKSLRKPIPKRWVPPYARKP